MFFSVSSTVPPVDTPTRLIERFFSNFLRCPSTTRSHSGPVSRNINNLKGMICYKVMCMSSASPTISA
ncbi:hypothetical protein SLEP1_g52683 [Rubroshorea leprosula]|uniref:Uncharacterized protein n=1 Tax=Rubroshorea leprosula TaxID=152421 RepID=A0AAV5MAG9_9ROSI|nr:hypothetical protein SLEP1_g52683 [Rubroshorea leprosula]